MSGDDIPNFDTNTWYQIIESRVDFNSSLQLSSSDHSTLYFSAACSTCLQYWQVIPSTFGTTDSANGSFVFRNRATSTSHQLGVCYNADEQDSSRTQPCMYAAGGGNLMGPFSKWDITTWTTDGNLKITNVGNGTNYNLDCHQGNPLFLSSNTAPQPKQVGQHWLFSSIGVINDQTYSTGIPTLKSTSSSSSASSTSSPSSSPSTSPSSSSSSGLSPGAAAGIGVGVGLAVLLAVLLGLFLFCRRRRRTHTGTDPAKATDYNRTGSGSHIPLNEQEGQEGYGQIDHKHGHEIAESPRYELSGMAPAELGTGTDISRELPSKSPGEGRSPIVTRT